MFDIGFGKLALIAVVALLVLGPERLPRVARTAGALLRRARNSWASVRTEIERELGTEELKRNIREAANAMDIRGDVNKMKDAIEGRDTAPAQPPPAPSDSPASAEPSATTPKPHEPN